MSRQLEFNPELIRLPGPLISRHRETNWHGKQKTMTIENIVTTLPSLLLEGVLARLATQLQTLTAVFASSRPTICFS